MRAYTIGEAAERSGFSASALRYYEGIGLVRPSTRTDAGYRLYDDHALTRLAFIGRAKQLGCTLEEITDLVSIWDGERCGPVQRRFHELVTEKIAGAQRQVSELGALTAQLQTAAAQLSGPATDGPCGAGCACLTTSEPVIACTLDPSAMPDRLADWEAVLAHVSDRAPLGPGGMRLELDTEVDLGELAQLVAAEQRCCSFLSFAVTVDRRGVGLEVHAPEDAAEIIACMFG